jgi:ketosteroid isomerase-like protein
LRLRLTDCLIRETSDPEVIVAEYDYDGEATRTGKRFTVANIQVFRVRDGRIIASRDFHDHAALSSALRPGADS